MDLHLDKDDIKELLKGLALIGATAVAGKVLKESFENGKEVRLNFKPDKDKEVSLSITDKENRNLIETQSHQTTE